MGQLSFFLPSFSWQSWRVNKMDGASQEDEEDSSFTTISLTDDTGKGEPDDIKISNCSVVV